MSAASRLVPTSGAFVAKAWLLIHERWVWKYCVSHYVKEQHAASRALTQPDPQTVRFRASLDGSETEKAHVAEEIRKGMKDRSVSATIVLRRGNGKRRASQVVHAACCGGVC
ncbi:unnamed protein product [Scytosiphon promiscuus]